MKSILKILPALIALPILVHVSCTSSDTDELPPACDVPSSSSLASDMVLCVVNSRCQAVSPSICDGFNGIKTSFCPGSPIAAKYCYNDNYDGCYIIGIFSIADGHYNSYYLDTDGCIAEGGAVVERDWCVTGGLTIHDD
jgi:hypothetical protein